MYHERQDEKQVIKTIRLRSADLAALQQLLGRLLANQDADRLPGSSVSTVSTELGDPPRYVALARQMIAARQLRSKYFKSPMFGEPAWDMLVSLYANSTDGQRQSVGRLSALSGSPPTTALRWLDYLVKEQMVVRMPNPTDARSEFVELTDKGRSAMELYLSETLRIPA